MFILRCSKHIYLSGDIVFIGPSGIRFSFPPTAASLAAKKLAFTMEIVDWGHIYFYSVTCWLHHLNHARDYAGRMLWTLLLHWISVKLFQELKFLVVEEPFKHVPNSLFIYSHFHIYLHYKCNFEYSGDIVFTCAFRSIHLWSDV